MARFVLRPCKIREHRIVPTGEPDLELDWPGLRARFAPTHDLQAKLMLRQLQVSGYVGRSAADGGPGASQAGPPRTFVFLNVDRSNKLGWVLQRDPGFAARVLEIYRVELAQWDHKVEADGN